MRINEGNPVASTTFCRESMTTSCGSSDDDSPTIPEACLPLTTFSIEDYVYRGEGNANVVVAIPKEQKVIRFRKSAPDDVSPDGGKQRAEREVEFVRFVASCFLGPYTQVPEILRYDMKDIARLSEAIRPFRPDKRRNKDITEMYATKFPDYTFLLANQPSDIFRCSDTYCVEIKPKQGYLRDIDRKFQKCPYCLLQYYKLKKNIITRRSSYCPFDLFSGMDDRMKSALKGLLKSPQNNLKIFKNGAVVYDQESSPSDLECVLTEWFRNSVKSTNKEYVDKFCTLVCAALLHPFASEECVTNAYPACELYTSVEQDAKTTSYINPDLIAKVKKFLYFTGEACNSKGQPLPRNSLLERILRMQRLPFNNSDYIYNTYLQFRPLLTDDVIYTNLIKMRNAAEREVPYTKQNKTIEKNANGLREAYIPTCAKNTSISKTSKLGNQNGNKHINGSSENVALVPTSLLYPSNMERNHSRHNKFRSMNYAGPTAKESRISINSEHILYLQNYLLFSCARDCSLLMSFREINPNTITPNFNKDVLLLPNGLSFMCNIQISDLDPKSLHCIEKHRQRDLRTLNSVISVLEEELFVKNQSSL